MKKDVKTIIKGAVLFLLGGFIVPLVIILSAFSISPDSNQFIVPGKRSIDIKESGRYYLWNNHKTVFNGKSYNCSEELPDGIEIKISNSKTGLLFEFVSDSLMSSSIGDSAKNSIGYIEIKNPCIIDIVVSSSHKDMIFSLSKFNLWAIFGWVIVGVIVSTLISLSGVVLVILGIVKLVKSNKKQEQNAPT